jgi:hypothetical protein
VLVVLAGIVLLALFIPAIDRGVPGAARRTQCKNNLKQIGLALHNYHDVFGCFPPAYVADEEGRPLHSWRVLILPYLDQAPLYSRYRFDEPWDGPNNRKLHEAVVDIYRCPSDPPTSKSADTNCTNYVAVVGPETMWPGSEGVKRRDITDGPSNTLIVVETANSGIHWMEPRDLHVLQMASTINSSGGQGMSSKHAGCAVGLLSDGAVRTLSEKLPAETLRALLTIKGKEPLTDNDF